MVPITFRFIISLTWCHRRSITPSCNPLQICHGHRQHFDSFQDTNQIHDDEYHPRPLVIWVTIDNILAFLPLQTYSCYGCNLQSSLSYVLPWSITVSNVEDVVRISPPLKKFLLQRCFSPSPFFLGPRVGSNQDTNRWTVLFGFCPSSNPIALKQMVGCSFLDYWLLNHHSNIDQAT